MVSLGSGLLWLSMQLASVRRTKIYVGLYLFSFLAVLAIGYVVVFRDRPEFLEFDEYEYFQISDRIMNGSFEIGSRRTIGFPLLVSAIRVIWGNFLFLQVVLAAIYAFSSPLIFRILDKLGVDRLPALVAGLVFAIWPPSLYYGASAYSETAALPVFLLALSILPSPWGQQAGTGRTIWLALLAGLILGIAAHIRPMYLLFIPVAAVMILIEDQLRRIGWMKIAALVAGFMVIVLPWSMHMQAKYQQPILLSANGGETLAGGLNPRLFDPAMHRTFDVSRREVWVGPGKWLTPYETGYLSDAEARLPYLEQDKLLRERATAWIMANPLDAATLEAYKIAYMWGIYPIFKNSLTQILFGNIPLLLLLVTSALFLIVCPWSRRRFVRLWGLAFFVSGVALISWGSWRFRQCADAGLIAYCVACAWTVYRNHLEKAGMTTTATTDAHGAANAPGPLTA